VPPDGIKIRIKIKKAEIKKGEAPGLAGKFVLLA